MTRLNTDYPDLYAEELARLEPQAQRFDMVAYAERLVLGFAQLQAAPTTQPEGDGDE